jgi:hypothetical protein
MLVLCTTALAIADLPSLAQNKAGPNLAATSSDAEPGGVARMGLAQELYAFGAARGDVVSVLAAAQLAARVDLTTAEAAELAPTRVVLADEDSFRQKAVAAADLDAQTAKPPDGSPRRVAKATFYSAVSENDGAADGPVTAEAMFTKARALAGDDAAMLDLIEKAATENTRGQGGGAARWLSRLSAGQTDVWELSFFGGSYAEVAVIGDSDTNLDVAVTDETGNVICSDVSWSDKFYCDWTPAWDGYFFVTVQNLGGSRNSYSLLVN